MKGRSDLIYKANLVVAGQLSDTEKQTLLVKLVLQEPKYLSVVFF